MRFLYLMQKNINYWEAFSSDNEACQNVSHTTHMHVGRLGLCNVSGQTHTHTHTHHTTFNS